MLIVREVYETEGIRDFLIKRQLLKQYLKSVDFLKKWFYWKLDFKERQPKWSWVYSFRINRQFRVFWFFDEQNDFIVSEINNHQ